MRGMSGMWWSMVAPITILFCFFAGGSQSDFPGESVGREFSPQHGIDRIPLQAWSSSSTYEIKDIVFYWQENNNFMSSRPARVFCLPISDWLTGIVLAF